MNDWGYKKMNSINKLRLSRTFFFAGLIFVVCFIACSKTETPPSVQIKDTSLSFTVNGTNNGTTTYKGLNVRPVIVLEFYRTDKSCINSCQY